MPPQDTHCFFAIRVDAQKEMVVRDALKNRNFACCVPRQTVKRRAGLKGRSGPYKSYKVVAAPGYVFVYLPKVEPGLHRLVEVRAVRSIVEFDGEPARISKSSMARFMRAVGERPREAAPTIFRKGDEIRVKDGPFADKPGTIADLKGERLILELVSGPRVTISRHQVERVSCETNTLADQKTALTTQAKSRFKAA